MTKTAKSVINKRWALVNTRTGKARTFKPTRDLARAYKRSTERIYDTFSGAYVR